MKNGFFKEIGRYGFSNFKQLHEKGVVFYIYNKLKVLYNLAHTFIHDYNRFIVYFYYKLKLPRFFTVNSIPIKYIYNEDTATWYSERCIEIPFIWGFIKKYEGKAILEVGNVLSQYLVINHDVIDKYDKGKGFIKQDVVSFQSPKKYDLIISISTFEHIGWDEKPRDSKKILKAIDNLKLLLTSNGKIIFTVPIGYNLHLDKYLKERKINLSRYYCLKRISKSNKWKEIMWDDLFNLKYGKPYVYANGLLIGFIEK